MSGRGWFNKRFIIRYSFVYRLHPFVEIWMRLFARMNS